MNKLLYKARNGIPYTERNLKSLLGYLGLSRYLLQKIFFPLFILSGIVVIIIACGGFNLKPIYPLIILGVFLIIFPFVVHFMVPYKKRRIKYLDSLEYFYKERFKNFEGYDLVLAGYFKDINSKLNKNNVLVFSDSYKFIIYDEPLIQTFVNLNLSSDTNSQEILKVIDKDALYTKPIEFMISDILSYELHGNICNPSYTKYYLYTKVFNQLNFDNYVLITLKNHEEIKLTTNVYNMLKKAVPKLEV